MSRVFEEHDYIGLSKVSSIEEQTSDKSKNSDISDKKNTKTLNFKATELRLGLPGSQSPENGVGDDDHFNYKNVGKFNNLVSGAKRGFSDAITGASNNWGLSENGGSDTTAMEENDDKKLQSSPPVSVQPSSAIASSK